MHWLLEHGAVEVAEGLESAGSPATTLGASRAHLAFVTRAAREFELPLDVAHQAAAMARRIRTGEGRWAWDGAVIDWQGNEITLLHAGVTQRIDRLVRRRDTGEWWVLDYKSTPRPEEQPATGGADDPVPGCGAPRQHWGSGAGGFFDGGGKGGGGGEREGRLTARGRSRGATEGRTVGCVNDSGNRTPGPCEAETGQRSSSAVRLIPWFGIICCGAT
jgi:hypothetical protein